MTLKRLALITTTFLIASTGFGCSNHSKTSSSDVVRFGAMDSNRNPLAMGAGDMLGVSLYTTHDLN